MAPGATVTATIANGPGNSPDWVGLFATGAPPARYLDWQYLNGTLTAPVPGLTGGTLTFTLPLTPGTYHVRFFLNNTYTVLATSATITVGGADRHAECDDGGAGRDGDGDDRERAGELAAIGSGSSRPAPRRGVTCDWRI